MPVDDVKTILICSANPKDMPQDRLADEQRLIASTLQSDKQREKYQIVYSTATTTQSLSRAMLTHKPSILHFCGRADRGGLYVEDKNGNAKAVDMHALLSLLDLFKDSLELVFLSGCYHPVLMENIKTQISDVAGILPHRELNRKDLEDLIAPFYEATFADRGAVWAADYARKAQKLDADKQHLAGLLVHHSDEIPANFEVPTIQLAKPEPAKLKNLSWVESLLPFLCDCTNMEMAFRRALRTYLQEPIRGPLVFFFLGDENDCLHKILERFRFDPLQKISTTLGGYPNWDFRSAGSEWPTSLHNFKSTLAGYLSKSLDLFAFDAEELMLEWPARQDPQVLPIRYDLHSWKGNQGEGLKAFCDFWNPLLGERFGQPLVIFFQIEFNENARFWKMGFKGELKRVRNFINSIEIPQELTIEVLPSTEEIRPKHIHNWMEHDLMQAFLGENRHQLDLIDITSSMKKCKNMKLVSKRLKKALRDLSNDYRNSV